MVKGNAYGVLDPERAVQPKLMKVVGFDENSNVKGLGILNFAT